MLPNSIPLSYIILKQVVHHSAHQKIGQPMSLPRIITLLLLLMSHF